MIALELLFFFIVISLGTVGFLQWHNKRNHPGRGHKGDAQKTAEEEELHKKLAHK